jgi:hypothetical protein
MHRKQPIATLSDLQTEVTGALANAAAWNTAVHGTTPVYVRYGDIYVPITRLHIGLVTPHAALGPPADARMAVILDIHVDPAR